MLDSVGIGALPDAAAYGDEGSDTLGNIASARAARAADAARARSRSRRRARPVRCRATPRTPFRTAVGRMAETSAGKDSVTGHWEMMGVVLERAVSGLSRWVLDRICSTSSRGRPAAACSATRPRRARRSSTSSGPSTCGPARWIVYTSADSVFQIAAHEDDRAAAGALSRLRDRLPAGRRGPRRRPRHRASLRRRARAASGARRTAATIALPPPGETLLDRLTCASRTGRRDRQDRGSVRRPRHHPRDSHGQRRRGHGRRCSSR